MAKSRARFLAELLGSDGLVKTTTTSLAGADGIIDLGVLPSIPNSKLSNSSITINSSATSLGGSITLTSANLAENTNLYYTNARADARITNAGSGNWNTAYGWGNHASGGYAPLSSPTLTGTPAAPTASGSTSTTQVATTAFVQQELTTLIGGAPSTLNDLNELAAAINDDANYNSTLTTALATKLPLAGGTLTGTLTMGSNAISSTGTGTFGVLAVDTMTLNGSSITGSSNLTLDVAGDIKLDADSSNIYLADGGTDIGLLSTNNQDINIRNLITDKDIYFQGKDGSSTITALTLDMSDGGGAHFNNDIYLNDGRAARFGNDQDFRIYNDGSHTTLHNATLNHDMLFKGNDDGSAITALTLDMSNAGKATFSGIVSSAQGFERGNMFITGNEIDVGSGDLTLDVAGDIVLDADGGDIQLKDAGVATGRLGLENGDLNIASMRQDYDIKFKGMDGNTTPFTALTLDMSEAGNATFNQHIYLGDNGYLVFGVGEDVKIHSDGTNGTIGAQNGNLTLDVAGDITLDANGGQTRLKDNGVEWLRFSNESAVAQIYSPVVNSDIHLVGIRAAGVVEALKLDMSDGGAARFSSKIQTGNMTLEHTQITQSAGNLKLLTTASGGHIELAAAGNVGIGIAAPGYPLEVAGATSTSIAYQRTGVSAKKWGFHTDNDNTYWQNITDNVLALTIKNNGNVGIGTTTPTTAKLDVAGTALVENAKLKAIAESNTDAAVDVFIYDTRKDSDGGAWRKRTQNTSWYNETLNTSIRGARKEFPSVAVIVAKSGAITIYDGDDPDMPMWMVFNGNSLVYGSVTAGLEILNGIMFFTGNVSCSEVNFITEFMGLHQATSISQSKAAWRGGILHRNSTAGSWRTEGAGTGSVIQTGTLINQSTNDIAMVVLPNAPINAATGLPVPTIALATNGGISIIKDNGIVVDIVNTQDSSTFNFCQDVHFRSDGAIVWSADSTGNSAAPRFIHVLHEIPSKDFVHIVVANPSNTDEFYSRSNTAGDLKFPSSAGVKALQNSTGITNVGTVDGLSNFAYNKIAPEEGLANYITSDYNTGYQVGNIKLAALSDTDTTNVAGTDLLGGIGNFSPAGSWSFPSGWSLSSNIATGSAVTAYLLPASNGILTTGKKYAVTVTQTSYTSGAVYMYCGTGAPGGTYYASIPSATGTYTFVLTAYNSNFGIYGANYTGVIDNVTVSLAEEDRSTNDNGLKISGTITKTAVATGADLVGYSGWSTSNFLRHPTVANYGSPATISFMGWQKTSAITNYQYMGSLQDGTSGRIIGMSIQAASVSEAGKPYFYDNTNSSLAGTIRVDDGQWHFCVGVLDGISKKLYIDGELNVSATVTALAMTNVTDTRVGFFASSVGGGVNYPHLGSVALLRLSGTAPTAEQIKKIYNDEKFLFQENAKATLHGTSDAVTALAYDEDTELLHVGTSAGRSEFQGLRRVHNTTDAVGAAINASNGFIVEE